MSNFEGMTKEDIDAWMQRNRARRIAAQTEDRSLMTPAEVARLLRVDPKTVTRWAANGKIRSARTPGGHRRFYTSDIKAIMDGNEPSETVNAEDSADV